MKQFLHLVTYKIWLFLVVSVKPTPRSIFKNLATGAVYAGFAYGIYKISFASLTYIHGTIHINLFLMHKLIAILLFMFFLSVNAGNILVSLTGLFRSKEINFLFTKPIAFEKIFIIKFFDNFFYSSATLFMILFAVLYAYGSYFKLGIGFYGIALFALFLPFMLIAALLGTLLLFFVLSVINRLGVRLTLLLLALFYLTATVSFFIINDPPAVVQNLIVSESYAAEMFSHFQHPLLRLLPNYWVSDSMYWFLKGNTTAVFRYSALLFFTAGLLLAANYGVAASFYFKSYHIAQTVKLRREGKSGKEKLSVVNFFKPWKRYPVTAVMLRKETALFFRDVSQVAQLSVMSLLIVLFVSSVSGRPHVLFLSLNPELQTVIYLVFFLFNSFLITSIALRFVYPLQSLEGEAFWRLRSAPLDYRSIVYGRFVAYYILLVTIALGLAIFSHRRFHPFLLMYSSLIMFFVTLTVCALNYSFGMYFADYKEKNPVRIASSQGASTAFLVCLLYLGIVIGVMFVPLYEFFLATRNLNQSPTFSGFLLSGGGIIFLSLIVTGVCFRLTRRYAEVDLV